MNWKFWTAKFWQRATKPGPPTASKRVEPVRLFDDQWAAKREAFLLRLENTPPQDPLMVGLLGLLDQEILIQVDKCQTEGLTDEQAHSLCGRLGTLVGLRRDLHDRWRLALQRKEERERTPPQP